MSQQTDIRAKNAEALANELKERVEHLEEAVRQLTECMQEIFDRLEAKKK